MISMQSRLHQPWESRSPLIHSVETYITAPEGLDLVVVKVNTETDGLYGLGCTTFTFRSHAVKRIVDEYLAPRVIGRAVEDAADIFRGLQLGPLWHNGPIENSALSGIDMALWDAKSKDVGRSVATLAGGRVRDSLATYRSAFGSTVDELLETVGRLLGEGETAMRLLVQNSEDLTRLPFHGRGHAEMLLTAFRRVRAEFGEGPDFVIDPHGKLDPHEAVALARDLEPLRPFYYEDPVANAQIGWFGRLRAATVLPLATGELFTNPLEYVPLLQHRLIDFIRCHVSTIGGFTPALTLARAAELFGVKTAWHGPSDLSPIGHAANATLGLVAPNFGIHEHHQPSETSRAVFPGALVSEGGILRPSTAPGWGVDFDVAEAAKYPPLDADTISRFEFARRADGSVHQI